MFLSMYLLSLIFVTGVSSAEASAEAEALPVTSTFGWREHPVLGGYRFHTGVDLGYDYGTMIPAMLDGQVIAAGDFEDGFGNQIVIYHPLQRAYTRYAHCSYIYVAAGDAVAAGQCIGSVGSTGMSTGPHLHLELIIQAEDDSLSYADPLTLWN